MSDLYVLHRGKYSGEPLHDVPESYLKWMLSVQHEGAKQAATEIERRRRLKREADISYKAIDEASLRLSSLWRMDANQGEGLVTWLRRKIKEARLMGHTGASPDTLHYQNITFIFDTTKPTHVLLSVQHTTS